MTDTPSPSAGFNGSANAAPPVRPEQLADFFTDFETHKVEDTFPDDFVNPDDLDGFKSRVAEILGHAQAGTLEFCAFGLAQPDGKSLQIHTRYASATEVKEGFADPVTKQSFFKAFEIENHPKAHPIFGEQDYWFFSYKLLNEKEDRTAAFKYGLSQAWVDRCFAGVDEDLERDWPKASVDNLPPEP